MLPSASLPGSGPMARFHANSAPSAPYRPEEVSASIALSTGNSRRTAPSSVRRGCRTGRGTRGPRGIAATPSSRLPASSSLPRRASAEVKKPSASFRTKRPSRNSAIPMGVPTKASPASARSDVTCGSGRPSASAKWSSAPPCQWYTPRSAVPIHKLPTSPASAVTFHPASEGSNGARLLPSQTTTPRPAVPSRRRPVSSGSSAVTLRAAASSGRTWRKACPSNSSSPAPRVATQSVEALAASTPSGIPGSSSPDRHRFLTVPPVSYSSSAEGVVINRSPRNRTASTNPAAALSGSTAGSARSRVRVSNRSTREAATCAAAICVARTARHTAVPAYPASSAASAAPPAQNFLRVISWL